MQHFVFFRRFLFKCLSMGHSQFAEIIGARGPNTQVNAACSSTTQALALAQDWIRARYRESTRTAKLVTPGKVERYSFDWFPFISRRIQAVFNA